MRPYHVVVFLLMGGVLITTLLAGCTSAPVNESATLEHQDSFEAVKIKTWLIQAPDLAGSAIDVDLDGERAILSGFVETEQQRTKAEAIASQHERVTSVDNNITVK
ncbi:BON domain-containing protein [Vreelandella sulfidaeris]|uniref:BON domain-containing protein n=1 Tax=Vreelandella sulfidaeris TaxID=115553 RepID=UPI0035EE8A80